MTIISILIIRGQYRLGVRRQAKLGGILYMRLTVGPSHHLAHTTTGCQHWPELVELAVVRVSQLPVQYRLKTRVQAALLRHQAWQLPRSPCSTSRPTGCISCHCPHLWRHIVSAAHNVLELLPVLEEHAESKVCCLELRLEALVCQQEVLRLQVPVDHIHAVTVLNHLHSRTREAQQYSYRGS